MKTITKECYTFGELLELEKEGKVSHAVVESVRQQLAEWATDDSWWYECVYDTWKEALKQIGFYNVEIHFSGFWSQGDGASFTASIDWEPLLDFLSSKIEPKDCIEPFPGQDGSKDPREDFRPWILYHTKFRGGIDRRWLSKIADSLYGRIVRHYRCGNYVHEHTCDLEIEFYEGNRERKRLGPLVKELEETVEELRVALCRAIYESLEEEYEYRTADEQLIEDCDANEWHFDLSGDFEF